MGWKKIGWVFAALTLFSAAIVAASDTYSYEEKLIRLQVSNNLSRLDERIIEEPLEIQALLLDYSDGHALDLKTEEGVLTVKAWLALLKYPQQAREVMSLYGSNPTFQRILVRYGEEIVPAISFFMANEVLTLKIQDWAGDVLNQAKAAASAASENVAEWFGAEPAQPVPTAPVKAQLGPPERGKYAIEFIDSEGHKFLGQFVVDAKGIAHWNLTDRIAVGVTSFFTSGISNLESKYRSDEKLENSDFFFAALDVIPFVVAAKLVKAGKVLSASGKELSIVSKTRLFAARLVPKNSLFQKFGKYGVVVATGYVLVTNPSLLSSVFRGVAELLGMNPLLVQFLGWFLILTLMLYPFTGLLRMVGKAAWLISIRLTSSPNSPQPTT